MSEVAGRLAVQIGAHYLERTHGGRGVLLAGVPGVPSGKVVIIGAGVVGLATTHELSLAGHDVRCFEKTAPGSAQSKGSTRIFRQAHGSPALVELAMRARRDWREWEDRFRRRLVGSEGLIVTGEEIVPAWEQALYRYMDASHPDVGKKIATEKALSPENEQQLRAAIDEFKQTATV